VGGKVAEKGKHLLALSGVVDGVLVVEEGWKQVPNQTIVECEGNESFAGTARSDVTPGTRLGVVPTIFVVVGGVFRTFLTSSQRKIDASPTGTRSLRTH